MRHYRRSLAAHGQVSPLFIADLVQPHLVGGSFADVGCGAGVPTSVMRARWPWTEAFINEGVERPHFIGVDFSARAVAYAKEYGSYDRVVLADSTRLPLDDGEVDVALSIENVEHLYPDEVLPALQELLRIARRRIILTTPWPWDVVNVPWLTDEINEAAEDLDRIDVDEYEVLAGCVHKSTLLPNQLVAAGFRCPSFSRKGHPVRHPVYIGDVDEIDLAALGPVLGIQHVRAASIGGTDFREPYRELLERSLALREQTPKFKRTWYARLAVQRARSGLSGLRS